MGDPTIGQVTNLYGLLAAVVVSSAWVAVELRRRSNGHQTRPNGEALTPDARRADIDLAIARHQEDCPVARRIETRLDRLEGRLEERLSAIDEALREVWRARAERGH